MFKKLVDLLREVFWLKPSKKKSPRRTNPKKPLTPVKKTAKKSPVKKVNLKTAVKTPLKASHKPQKALKVTEPTKTVKKKEIAIDPNLSEIGIITHYFERIKVCVVKITNGTVLIGDRLTILGSHTKVQQKVWSMQIESVDVKVAKKGQLIGLKIDKPVVVGDKVYK